MPQRLFEPTDAAGVAAVLQSAAADRLAVTVRGGGTKSPTQGPAEVVLSTTRLTEAVDHVAGDLVATAPAGATLDAVNTVLQRERQWLPTRRARAAPPSGASSRRTTAGPGAIVTAPRAT